MRAISLAIRSGNPTEVRAPPRCARGPSIRRGCGVGRRITGVRLAANTERTGALKTGTAHLHARAPVVLPAQVIKAMTTGQPVVRVLVVLAEVLDVSLLDGGGPKA